jgi:acyl transferase domain-containing protein
LVGLHNACRALQVGDCSAALVAGTSLIMGPYVTGVMTHHGVLFPEGSCKTFDAAADGFARAEAINAIYIKLLDDAIRDGNPVRAVIRGTLTNSDDKSASLMAPNGESHEELMRNVYAGAGLDPKDTAFVECHGTGTPTGDPIETTAVGNTFGERGVIIGSIKPNIGHAEGASGLNSVIKAVLALEHLTIPPNIKFNSPNPKIPFQAKKITIPLRATPWPEDRAQRVSINSFGIGGTNAHVIIDSASEVPAYVQSRFGFSNGHDSEHELVSPAGRQLMLLSANSQESLMNHMANVQEYLVAHPDRIADVAYTLAQRRENLPHRGFFLASPSAIGVDVSSSVKVPASPLPITMIFGGQGAQWPQMGADMIKTDVEFRKDIRAMDEILKSLKYPPSWTIEGKSYPSP